jgi:hypothetical protein
MADAAYLLPLVLQRSHGGGLQLLGLLDNPQRALRRRGRLLVLVHRVVQDLPAIHILQVVSAELLLLFARARGT